jgi:hypothetical protein
VLATTDHSFVEDLEKRLQKRLVIKARSSFHMEDFEIHSPGEKAIEKSEVASGGRDREEPKRRRRRKRALGSPADVEAMLAEEEQSAVTADGLAESENHGRANGSVANGDKAATPVAVVDAAVKPTE